MGFKGITFWCDDESEKNHLRFVISDPDVYGNVLTVNMTTLYNRERADISCVLDCGDHPGIKHESFVAYQKALGVSVEKIMTKILRHCYKNTAKLTDEILRKIQEGAKKSNFLPQKLKKYFEYF
ncbi:hypothetical protein [Candidatus Endomicrobiellum trichonymphae]|uniref:hypothetical protein n=1 Tax=Endomicrobium trichonymphae TaxID=1408204 RepID=UPI000BBA972B|nr:hypothetical protein [Candidatus Endomicrobium trichonymphae]